MENISDGDYNYEDLLELKQSIEKALDRADSQLLFFPLDDSDDDFRFLVNKAIQYRELLQKINNELSKF